MINFANILITTVLTIYIIHFIQIYRSKEKLQVRNNELDDLRAKPLKTLEEQKAFINLKYPKAPPKTKYFAPKLWRILKSLALYIPIALGVYWLIKQIPYEIPLWVGIAFIFVFPFIINLILSKWHLEKDKNLLVMMRGWRRAK
jgi:hypothetical protein